MYFPCISKANVDISSYSLLSVVFRSCPHGTRVSQTEVDHMSLDTPHLPLIDRVMRFRSRVWMKPQKEQGFFLTHPGIAFPFHVHYSVPITSASPHLLKAHLKAAE